MDGVTSAQFISAGIHFYPRCGYKRLSEQAIAEHLNSNLETFNRMFADKDEFVKAMLIEYSNRALGRVSFDFAQNIEDTERLYQIVWRLAVTIREHLAWIHRMLLDSEEGVDLITKALKKQHKMLAYGMIRHIKKCNGREGVSELELLNQFEFLNGAVISPMIMNTRYRMAEGLHAVQGAVGGVGVGRVGDLAGDVGGGGVCAGPGLGAQGVVEFDEAGQGRAHYSDRKSVV